MDKNKRAAVILAGHPRGELEADGTNNWDNLVQRVAKKLATAGTTVRLTQKWQQKNRRGDFKALATGISFGNGQKVQQFHLFYAIPQIKSV